MSDYGHESYSSYNNGHCNVCGGTNGHHYSSDDGGSCSYGGGIVAELIFTCFVVAGIFFGALCAPLGALIIVIGAAVTGV